MATTKLLTHPLEVQNMIIESLPNASSKICLALTCHELHDLVLAIFCKQTPTAKLKPKLKDLFLVLDHPLRFPCFLSYYATKANAETLWQLRSWMPTGYVFCMNCVRYVFMPDREIRSAQCGCVRDQGVWRRRPTSDGFPSDTDC